MDASQSDFFGFSVFLKSWIFMGHKAQWEIVLGRMSTQCTLSSWCAHNKDKMNFRGEWTLLVANVCSVNRWKCFRLSEKFVLIPEFCKFASLTNLQRGKKRKCSGGFGEFWDQSELPHKHTCTLPHIHCVICFELAYGLHLYSCYFSWWKNMDCRKGNFFYWNKPSDSSKLIQKNVQWYNTM